MGEAEDNKRLAARWMSELWSETILGIAATGNRMTVSCMDLLHFKSGRIVESWPCYDLIGMLMQLGAFKS